MSEFEGDFQRILGCRLLPEERYERSQSLIAKLEDRDEIEREKKAAAEAFKERLEDVEKEARRLRAIVKTGYEPRSVLCRWVDDWAHNVRRLIRQDTGETVEERTISAEEHQLKLDSMNS